MRRTIHSLLVLSFTLAWVGCEGPAQSLRQEAPASKPGVDWRPAVAGASGASVVGSAGGAGLERRFDLAAHPGWGGLVEAFADREALGEAFEQAGYQPPESSFLLLAVVEEGAEGLAYRYYSLGDSAFLYSYDEAARERFWPASTVKLMAAVGALRRIHELGFGPEAIYTVEDEHGLYSGPVSEVVEKAIVVSSNPAYNRLMILAGMDRLNDRYLTAAEGFPTMVLQRRYQRLSRDSNLRHSPAFVLEEGAERFESPAEAQVTKNPECSREGNCTTLFELLEGLRRVVLYEELATDEAFAISESASELLGRVLLEAPSFVEEGAERVLGPVEVWNKAGKVRGDDLVDHALIRDGSGQRLLIALSVPYAESLESPNELAAQALLAWRDGALG